MAALPLILHPDRLFPADPRHPRPRARALRDGRGDADREPARPHRSAMVCRRRAVSRCLGAVHHAGSLRLPHALQPGHPPRGSRHSAPRRRPGRERRPEDLAHVRRALSPVSRHADARLARPRVRDGLRLRRAAHRRIGRSHVRPHQRLPRATGVPSARAVRAFQHRGDRDDRVAARPPRAAQEAPGVGLEGSRDHGLPARSGRRSGIRELPGERAAIRRPGARGHGDLEGLPRRASGAARLFQDDGRYVDGSRPPDGAHLRPSGGAVPAPAGPRAGGNGDCGRGGTVPRADADRNGADEHRRRARDADPSRLVPEPQSARLPRLRPRQGRRHPDGHRLRPRA